MTLGATLWRGVLAGVLAGLLAGLFGLMVAEPSIDRAIALEEQKAAAEHPAGGHAEEEDAPPFSRDVQKFGFNVGTIAAGGAFGALFALVYAAGRRREDESGTEPAVRPWSRSLLLAAGGFAAVYLMPTFIRYPANPPGVGDPETIGDRTTAWLVAVLIGLGSIAVAARVRRWLAHRGHDRPVLDVSFGAIVVVGLVAMFLLPDNNDPVEVPATLLWEFRLSSAAVAAVMWLCLGGVFGLLAERTRSAASATPTPDNRQGRHALT